MSRLAHPAGPRHADVLPAEHPPMPPADLNALDPAIWPRGARRAGGVLTLAGADVRDLAQEFGTPLFVLDEEDFRSRCRDFRQAFGESSAVFYAAKAFCSRGVLRWIAQEGLGVDVCTGGELEVALQAGVAPAMITFHGSNKLIGELEDAVGAGVGHIVVDSFEEIARLAYLTESTGRTESTSRTEGGGGTESRGPAGEAGHTGGAGGSGETAAAGSSRYASADRGRPKVLVRVTSGVEAHTHEFVATAHDDQKFGFSLSSARPTRRYGGCSAGSTSA